MFPYSFGVASDAAVQHLQPDQLLTSWISCISIQIMCVANTQSGRQYQADVRFLKFCDFYTPPLAK